MPTIRPSRPRSSGTASRSRDQGDGDLGERMARAFARVLARHGRALLIGTDAPRLDAAYLRAAAARAARGTDAVFGPALDGGYTLVGLQRAGARAVRAACAGATPR